MNDMKPSLDTLSQVPSVKAEWIAPSVEEIAVLSETQAGGAVNTDSVFSES